MGIFTKAGSWFSATFGLTDPLAGQYLTGAAPSAAGPSVTVNTALQLSAVWACVRIISETIAGLPLGIYKEDNSGNGVLDRNHQLHEILRYQPNADMTAFEFWMAMVAGRELWGNSYAEISKNSLGNVIALTPMASERVTVRRDSDGSIFYLYNDLFGAQRRLEEDQVFHLKGFSLNGLVGLSPIACARQSMGSALATDRAAAAIFANGLRPSALYATKDYLKEDQRKRYNEILSQHSGNENRGGFLLLEGGATFASMTIPPEDAQMLATREFNVDEICRWFRVPPWIIGHTARTTSWGTGLEQQMIGFLTFALKTHTDSICSTIRRSLLSPQERAGVEAKYDFNDLLRADSVGRAALYGVLAQNGLRTRNELRAQDGVGPLPGGDDLTVQSNLVPIEKLGQTAPAQTPGNFGLHVAPSGSEKEPPHAQ